MRLSSFQPVELHGVLVRQDAGESIQRAVLIGNPPLSSWCILFKSLQLYGAERPYGEDLRVVGIYTMISASALCLLILSWRF